MKKIFFTPGPAMLYPTVEAHLKEALEQQLFCLSHRSKAYEAMHARAVEGVKALLGVPADFQVFFHSSANEIWERLIQNCADRLSLHFVNGAFSSRYFQFAQNLKVNALEFQAPWGESVDFEAIDIPEEADLINFTHNETSTGVMLDLEKVYAFRQSHPDALLTLDIVSSAPYPELDWERLDAAYFSVQKCFGLPAGLGVLVVGPRALARSEAKLASGQSTGSYHSFQSQLSKAVKNQTPETPNLPGIYLLGKVAEDMLHYGVEKIRKETDEKAALLYRFFQSSDYFSPFVKRVEERSPTVAVVDTVTDSNRIINSLSEKGLVPGNGYGKMKGKQLRIANFPAVSTGEVEALIEQLAIASENGEIGAP